MRGGFCSFCPTMFSSDKALAGLSPHGLGATTGSAFRAGTLTSALAKLSFITKMADFSRLFLSRGHDNQFVVNEKLEL